MKYRPTCFLKRTSTQQEYEKGAKSIREPKNQNSIGGSIIRRTKATKIIDISKLSTSPTLTLQS